MNSTHYPEAWALFIEHARNIEGLSLGANYQIPHPNGSGEFIQADDPGVLFQKFNRAHMDQTNVGAKVRKFIDWLEGIEGKGPRTSPP
jgi:hypothetical protein